MPLNKKQKEAYEMILSPNNSGEMVMLIGAGGCVDKDTEFLTETGWKFICDYTEGDKVLLWEQDGSSKFEKPQVYIKNKAETLTRVKTATIDMVLSEKHRVPYITSKGNSAVKEFKDFKQLSQAKVPRTYKAPHRAGIPIPNTLIRVLVMQSADASIVKRKTMPNQMRINVKKSRKRLRCVKLLEDAGIPYTVYNYTGKDNKEWLRLSYTPPEIINTKSLKVLWGVTKEQAIVASEELPLWDGSTNPRNGKPSTSFCGNHENVDVAQHIFTITDSKYVTVSYDKRAYIHAPIATAKKASRESSVIEINPNIRKDKTSPLSEYTTLDGYEYCFTTSTGFWVARRNGKVFPTGNCGKTYTLSEIVQNYNGKVAVTALTHKAKKVLQEAGIKEVSTIHAFLNLIMVRDGYKMKLIHNSKKKMKTTGLLIVDEVSQLTASMYRLLEQGVGQGLYERVVLVGDSTQLPSVGDIVDLSRKGLQTIELTQQMRQDPSKLELQTYLNHLRDSIATGTELDISNPPPEIVYIDNFKDFAKEYVECKSSKIILAHRNRCIDSYNSNIASNAKFLESDVVVIDKPWGGFNNQDTLAIHSVEEEDDRFVVKFFEEAEEIYHYKSDSAMNLVLDKFVNASDEEGYWELKDKCFKLKHLYAQTVFKSQGSSYSTVFLDGTDIETAHTQDKTKYNHPISHDLMLRLFYVGISRMRTKCYIFTGGVRDYKQLKRIWS